MRISWFNDPVLDSLDETSLIYLHDMKRKKDAVSMVAYVGTVLLLATKYQAHVIESMRQHKQATNLTLLITDMSACCNRCGKRLQTSTR